MSDKLEQEARGIITIYKPEISVYCQCNMTYPFLNRVAPQIHQLSISKVGQHCILLATASHVHPKKKNVTPHTDPARLLEPTKSATNL